MNIKCGGVLMFTACCLHYTDFSITVYMYFIFIIGFVVFFRLITKHMAVQHLISTV